MTFFQSPRNSTAIFGLSIFTLLALNGCMPPPKPDTDQYSDTIALQNADVAPEIHHRVKVLFLGIKTSDNTLLSSVDGSQILGSLLKKEIDEMGAERIDPNNTKALADVWTRCEAYGRSCFSSEQEIPDLVISGEFTDVETHSNFDEKGVDFYNAMRNKVAEGQRDGSCNKSVKVFGTLKIRALNGMTLKDSVLLEGKADKKVDMKQHQCVFNQRQDGPRLVEEAIRDSISLADKETIRAQLAPRGYVKEARINPSAPTESLVHTSLTLGQYVKPGNKVVFYRQHQESGKYANRYEISMNKITEGRIVKNEASQYAWVMVEDQSKVQELRVGDVAQVVYRSWCDGTIQRKLCGD